MELTPETYRCADDGHDLTELVRDQLEDYVPTSFTRAQDKDFLVMVTCPGGPGPHQVRCTGRVRRGR